jgi:two-component system response regulator RegA
MDEKPEKASVLVVDDDETFRTRLVRAFCGRGYDAAGAATACEATEFSQSDSPEFAVVDLRIGDGSGLDVVTALKEIDPTTNIVVLTGYGSIATAIEAIHYLTKPADVDDILAAFEPGAGGAEAKSEPIHEVPTLARVEWEHIQRILMTCDGNISLAARLLGIHRRSLQRKLTKYPSAR